MEIKPIPANQILQVSKAQSANIAFANARAEMFKPNAQKMKELANSMRVVIQTQCESYKKHVAETYLDCEYKKIKVSKAKARVPKYARGITK